MFIMPLLKLMADKDASDMFFSVGAPINIKINGTVMPVNQQALDAESVKRIIYEMMNPQQIADFEANLESNFSFRVPDVANFRVNAFRQKGGAAMVIRHVKANIPDMETLKLPPIFKELIMEKRGMILVVGSTGSGKSTTLASMLEYRNTTKTGHILTIEDPVEFIFQHKKCIVNQREVGMDTLSYSNALINAMREAPDVMMIGEIRDRDTLKHALIFAQTGHLCMATLHANNSYHGLNRIINFFPHDARPALLADLAISLRCVISQRLVRGINGKMVPAVEVLLNTKHISELVAAGEINQIKDAMEQSLSPGSQTFEQALYKLIKDGLITREEAMIHADSPTNLATLIDYSHSTQKSDEEAAASSTSTTKADGSSSFEGFTLNTDLLDK